MTMPHARKITVRGCVYSYQIKARRNRYAGSSSSHVDLIVDFGNKFVRQEFLSKLWKEEEHDEGYSYHLNSFTPKDVKVFIESILDNGSVPENFETLTWKIS